MKSSEVRQFIDEKFKEYADQFNYDLENTRDLGDAFTLFGCELTMGMYGDNISHDSINDALTMPPDGGVDAVLEYDDNRMFVIQGKYYSKTNKGKRIQSA